ncbi:hypothetical protein W04_1529 [Pseudoalteromonas sp. SW0106-04]|nr:hypothetical protein W04_1529 [Pseudoalteromonas sp. SW0106-04]
MASISCFLFTVLPTENSKPRSLKGDNENVNVALMLELALRYW